MEVLGAADEPNRGHAEAALFESPLGPGDDLRVVGEAEVVVGAKINHLALRNLDGSALGRGDDALLLEGPRVTDAVELFAVSLADVVKH